MPHQCVKCGTIFPNGAQELLKGCSNCHARFFFFVREKNLAKAKEVTANLSDKDKEQIEKDVLDIVGDKIDDDYPVILDFESVKISKPGKYEIDLVDLFKSKPLIYKLGDGKYMIDIVSTFEAKDKSSKDSS